MNPWCTTVTTVETSKAPTSWKELVEIEARNRAAEQLANISEASGDAKSYDADDFDQSLMLVDLQVMTMYIIQMRIIHILQTKDIQMTLNQ